MEQIPFLMAMRSWSPRDGSATSGDARVKGESIRASGGASTTAWDCQQ